MMIRDVPFEPTTQGPGGGGSSAPPPDQARVQVVSPAEGDTILRATFIEAPGKEVVAAAEAGNADGGVGGDLVEVYPMYDHAEITAMGAANVLFEFISLLALGRKDTGGPAR